MANTNSHGPAQITFYIAVWGDMRILRCLDVVGCRVWIIVTLLSCALKLVEWMILSLAIVFNLSNHPLELGKEKRRWPPCRTIYVKPDLDSNWIYIFSCRTAAGIAEYANGIKFWRRLASLSAFQRRSLIMFVINLFINWRTELTMQSSWHALKIT